MFITFEGINGSGKSTQAKLLYKYFLENGIQSILTKGIGGGGEFCMEIRRILCTTKDIDNLTELFVQDDLHSPVLFCYIASMFCRLRVSS